MPVGNATYLVITIDTEEDNWSDYSAAPAVSNIPRLLELQKLFDAYGAKPTYLISYPVAADEESSRMLRSIMEEGRCEIGAHLHPWNTPPFEEEKTVKNTMLFRLDAGLQYRKMESLHAKIHENFGMEPDSFRTGRWGFDRTVAGNLHRLGYKVDSSVSPYINWETYHGPDFSDWRPKPRKIRIGNDTSPESYLLEVPATIGFLQSNQELCDSIYNTISDSRLRHFRLRGVLDRLNLLNKVWLSPEPDTSEKMIRLASMLGKKEFPVLNMFFHSPSLRHGLTHFTKTVEEERELFGRIERFLKFMGTSGIRSIGLSESLKVTAQTA
jgi:peptidoglycan/xylan/chitin deacetylase (PgdA/CDA1 family)